MAELRKHREISEIIFGLGLEGTIDWHDIDTNMLVYPYNAATQDRRDKPDDATQAALITRYGADAINAAKAAAEQVHIVHNGIPPKEWLDELTRIYGDYQIVNVMNRARKKIEKNEGANYEELRDVIERRLATSDSEALSWADIKDEFRLEWIWPNWIPYGEITILVGRQGAGKSAFALYLADCVANGKPLPDGSIVPDRHSVLWVETEGRFAENVRRARAWDVDPSHIYSPLQDMRTVMDLSLPEHKIILRNKAHDPEIGLIVIDSLGGSLVDENDASAKRTLQEISRLAQETNTTILVIHHLRKPDPKKKGYQSPTLNDVRGHSGITQFAPSVIAIDYDGNEGMRQLYPLKMNLVEMPNDLWFSMGPRGLIWNQDTMDRVHRQVVQETVSWLEGMLKAGPMTTKEVVEMAERSGHELDILNEALKFPVFQLMDDAFGNRCVALS